MKRLLILASFLFLLSAIPLNATSTTDPGIGLDDPPNCASGTQVFGAFTFSANSAGGGFACFVNGNAGSPTITSVDIETSGNFGTGNCSGGSSITGFSNAFDSCSVTFFAAADVTDIRFSESSSALTSIAPGAVFEVDLNISQSCSPQLSTTGTCTDNGPQVGHWGPSEFFAAETNLSTTPSQPFLTTPEPSTLSLLALGIMGMAAFLATKKKLGEIL